MSAALKGSIAAGQGARISGAHVLHRKAFSGQAVSMTMPRKQHCRRGALVVRAFEDEEEEPREWPYPKFVQGIAASLPTSLQVLRRALCDATRLVRLSQHSRRMPSTLLSRSQHCIQGNPMLKKYGCAEVREKFPEKAVATVEEARVSTSGSVAIPRSCSLQSMLSYGCGNVIKSAQSRLPMAQLCGNQSQATRVIEALRTFQVQALHVSISAG